MCFLDVAFLHSLASFQPHFEKNCRRSEGLMTTTCSIVVMSVEFHGDHKAVRELR